MTNRRDFLKGIAAVGAALANRQHGRVSINLQPDGDLMYAPGVLWTSAHHNIPLLSVVHNNRAYHQEVMHLQRMPARRQRGADGRPRSATCSRSPLSNMPRWQKEWAYGRRDPSMIPRTSHRRSHAPWTSSSRASPHSSMC